MNKRLGRPTGAAGSLFSTFTMSNSGTRGVQTRAQPRGGARGYAELAKQKEVPNHASAKRVTRALSGRCVEFRGSLPSCLSAEGFCPPPVNPVVVTLVRVDRSPIGRASSRARGATRSVD